MSEDEVKFMTEAPMPVQQRGATYMTVSELAEKLDVHRNSVIYWINTGQIEARRQGMAPRSPWLIPIEEAERIIENFPDGPD